MQDEACVYELGHEEKELLVCRFGQEECAPSHRVCLNIPRGCYQIHFVRSGCGMLHCKNGDFPVHAGQGFVILPEEEAVFTVDQDEPCCHAWVGYQGKYAYDITRRAGLDETHRVYRAADSTIVWQVLKRLREEATYLPFPQMAAVGNLLRFICFVSPMRSKSMTGDSLAHRHCEKLHWYFENNYSRDVSIQEAAEYVGLSRSHLYRILMDEIGISPKTMLMRIRISHAKKLLATTHMTCDQISQHVGLQTATQLGAVFRLHEGMTPRQFREKMRAGLSDALPGH